VISPGLAPRPTYTTEQASQMPLHCNWHLPSGPACSSGAARRARPAAGAAAAPARRRAVAVRSFSQQGGLVNHYEVLGVPPDATTEAIKSRFKQLAKSTHPDVNDAANAAEQFVAIKRAYDTLSQDLLRSEHDQQLGAWRVTWC
jgi:hypothetical protein